MLMGVFALVVSGDGGPRVALGGLLRSMPPLRAYAIDITGSLAGIAAFTAMSFAGHRTGRLDGRGRLLVTLLGARPRR